MLDSDAIQEIIPHRYPFLLVDRIVEMDPGESLVAIKNVSINEPYFQGHFPGRPIMPGVLILEGMAQAGGFLLLHTVENPETKLMYLSRIEGARFRQPVVPGDQLRFEMRLLKFRLGSCKIEGKAFVGDDLVAETVFLATIGDRKG
ncbi:MAG: 3-hydroxyacyl-ACP dehydratase FabZ [Fidelibacterota bacterium]